MLKFRSFVETLNTVLEDSGKKVAWVASGDMAHVGRKFDDQFDAETIVDTLSCEDAELLAAMEKADAEKYFDRIAAVGDSRKICGLPPVYTMLEALKRKNTEIVGQTLDYQIWNERSTRSAVSYASLAYYRGCSD